MKPILMALLFVWLCLAVFSCSKLSQPTETIPARQVKMEIVNFNDTPPVTDSAYYLQKYVQWNTSTSYWDTLKADSLARWFAGSQYNITDMWFPESPSRCGRPDDTYNYVIIKLAASGSKLLPKGFKTKYIGPFDFCFDSYRHYTFVRDN